MLKENLQFPHQLMFIPFHVVLSHHLDSKCKLLYGLLGLHDTFQDKELCYFLKIKRMTLNFYLTELYKLKKITYNYLEGIIDNVKFLNCSNEKKEKDHD